MMESDETENADVGFTTANDNGDAPTRIDAAVLRLARLLGRQMAREHFRRPAAANDNRRNKA